MGSLIPLLLVAAPDARASWPNDASQSIPVLYGMGSPTAPGPAGSVWCLADSGLERLMPDGTLAFASPQPIGYSTWWPGAALLDDGDGGLFIAWNQVDQYQSSLRVQHVDTDGNALWSAGGVVVSTDSMASYPHLALGPNQSLDVVWTLSYTPASILTQQWLSDGSPAGAPLTLAVGANGGTAIAPDGADGWYVAWNDGTSLPRLQHVLAPGSLDAAWPAAGIALAASASSMGTLLPDGSGGVFATFRAGTSTTLQRIGADGSPASGWGPSGLDLGTGRGSPPLAALDGADGVWVAWTAPWSPTENQTRAQHVSSAGAIDPAFPAGGVLPFGADPTEPPRIVSAGPGVAMISTYDDQVQGVVAQRLPLGSDPSPGWPANGRLVLSALSTSPTPLGLRWTGDGLLVVMEQAEADGPHVTASRVDSSGYLGTPQPGALAVTDVRPDQGGHLHVFWEGSYLDPYGDIDHYTVERGVIGTTGGPWTVMDTVPAHTTGYGYAVDVPSPVDSTPAANPLSPFRVVAHDAAGDLALISATATGYSTDDIAPAAPGGVGGAHDASDTYLFWSANTEPDLCCYRVYRGDTAAFPLDLAHRISEQSGTGYVDVGVLGAYYQITAVDVHGNESAAAAVGGPGLTSTGVGSAVRVSAPTLAEPMPSPAHGAVMVRFGAPAGVPLRVEAFDVSGRRVSELFRGVGDGLEHALRWEPLDAGGARLASGVYLMRMSAPGTLVVRRVVITR